MNAMKREKFLEALGDSSDKKINLYVTGGGQNSACTAGMLEAIALEGWTDRFHRYIGQSSGSFSIMYLLGGATHEGAAGYWRALPKAFKNRRFINPWNLFNPFRPVMDLHYMVDVFFDTEPCCMPWERVLEHPANREGRFLVQVLNARTGKNLFLSRFTTVRALRAAIKASSWIPILAGMRPFRLDKELLAEMRVTDLEGNEVDMNELHTYDGQLANSFFGETYRARPEELHLVLTNIARDGRARLMNPFGPRLLGLEKLLSWVLFWWCLPGRRAYEESMLDGGQQRDFDALSAETLDESTGIIGVSPTENVPVGRYVLDEATMRRAVLAGFGGLYAALGLPAAKAPW
jgi:hypothetical protein